MLGCYLAGVAGGGRSSLGQLGCAASVARRRKPAIPLLGLDDVPLREEIELALPLADS